MQSSSSLGVGGAKPVRVTAVNEHATQRARQAQQSAQRERLLRELGDVDADVRRAAARGLGSDGHDDVAGALRAAIAQERDGTVRVVMVAALVRLGGDALLREVARSLKSADAAVVAGAVRVLAAVGDRRVVPNLVDAFRTDDVVIGAAVAAALGDLGDPVVVPWLAAAADQGFCVAASCRALGALGDPRALPALQKHVDDDDARIRLAAREALHRFAERGASSSPSSAGTSAGAAAGDGDGDDSAPAQPRRGR